jgi:hypothetical protein
MVCRKRERSHGNVKFIALCVMVESGRFDACSNKTILSAADYCSECGAAHKPASRKTRFFKKNFSSSDVVEPRLARLRFAFGVGCAISALYVHLAGQRNVLGDELLQRHQEGCLVKGCSFVLATSHGLPMRGQQTPTDQSITHDSPS